MQPPIRTPLARHLVLLGFFAALAVIEIGHGMFRLGTLRENRRREIVQNASREHEALVTRLRSQFEESTQHARYLSRLPAVRELLVAPAKDTRAELSAQILPYLIAFRGIDRIRVLDRHEVEVFRCERIGGGAGVIPPELLRTAPDAAIAPLAERARSGEVIISDLFVDNDRVEVAPSDRDVFHYVTAVTAPDHEAAGSLVLTVYAAPLLNSVRRFSPVPGAQSSLVDEKGADITGASASRPATDGDLEEGILLDVPIVDAPVIRMVTAIWSQDLDRAIGPLSGEHFRVIASMVAVTLILAAAGWFFMRLSLRAWRLAQEKELERQLQTSERLSSIGLLTAGVAHEINNPLEGIGNYLSLLEREGLPEERRRRYLEQVRHGFTRIRDIVRDLLSFARPAMKAQSADLQQIVNHALTMVRYAKEFQQIKVTLRGLDAPMVLPGDPGRLEQVFLNLILNAATAMQAEGSLTITAHQVAGAAPDMPEVEVLIEDTGPGIPENALTRIFDPFFTTTGGTGLGLAVTYGIVRAHGGTITASNRPEGGARFAVRLPLTENRA